MRMFGTVCKDLKRPMTARIKPLPSMAAKARRLNNKLMITLVTSGFSSCVSSYIFTVVEQEVEGLVLCNRKIKRFDYK